MFLFILLVTNLLEPSYEETVALILARGGSKGVHLKNLQTVGGISLLARAIGTAKKAGIEDVTVSTDNLLIALEALKNGANIFHRSPITATDSAPSIWGAAEFMSKRPSITILVLIQATSPFIRAEHVYEAIIKIEQPLAFDCVFSVTRSYKLRWAEFNDRVFPINFMIGSRPRRQDWKGELLETGAFYISRRHLMEGNHFQNHNCTAYEVPIEYSLEVDTFHDLQVANVLLSSNLVKT